eukprot:CAMPEP_0119415880 /NCGR_PEP_ID=MMETSP1335-20130426/10937_1 /TAXON_ID=259385 /ORGANISM="Chrysoculter rhomboideus, Strain RCC1486" /LENGTH=81 /DNA_ID=CAMNT_0007440941 /DNA_START=54 /DNA_END=296 /DNA_ORIENTATION=+
MIQYYSRTRFRGSEHPRASAFELDIKLAAAQALPLVVLVVREVGRGGTRACGGSLPERSAERDACGSCGGDSEQHEAARRD